MRTTLAALLIALAACAADVDTPSGALIACSAESPECPQDLECVIAIGRCVQKGANDIPSVTIQSIARSDALVHIPIQVFDVESDPVTLEIELEVAGMRVPISVAEDTVASDPL